MIRTTLKILLMSVVVFLLVEFSYRAFVIGPSALNPFSSSSYTTLLASGFVKPGSTPDIYYELKPNLNVELRGVPLVTNSDGLADKEYSKQKPDNTFRIAVVGSSWTMPASIPMQDSFHWLVEDDLNASKAQRSDGLNYEVINFGVEFYGVGEILATIKHRVLDYEPDLIIVALTGFTVNVFWQDYQEPFDAQDAGSKFMRSYILMQAGITEPPMQQRITIPDELLEKGRYRQQLASFIHQSKGLAEAAGVDIMYMSLGYRAWTWKNNTLMTDYAESLGFDYLDGAGEMERQGPLAVGVEYKVGRFDKHPNAMGHRLIADILLAHLAKRPQFSQLDPVTPLDRGEPLSLNRPDGDAGQ